MIKVVPKADTLAHIMYNCKETSSNPDGFLQSVEAAPAPMTVLASRQQLADVERYYCSSSRSSVISIDPTYNLGNFYVTLTTFRN
jgi:hypothetical protein